MIQSIKKKKNTDESLCERAFHISFLHFLSCICSGAAYYSNALLLERSISDGYEL